MGDEHFVRATESPNGRFPGVSILANPLSNRNSGLHLLRKPGAPDAAERQPHAPADGPATFLGSHRLALPSGGRARAREGLAMVVQRLGGRLGGLRKRAQTSLLFAPRRLKLGPDDLCGPL